MLTTRTLLAVAIGMSALVPRGAAADALGLQGTGGSIGTTTTTTTTTTGYDDREATGEAMGDTMGDDHDDDYNDNDYNHDCIRKCSPPQDYSCDVWMKAITECELICEDDPSLEAERSDLEFACNTGGSSPPPPAPRQEIQTKIEAAQDAARKLRERATANTQKEANAKNELKRLDGANATAIRDAEKKLEDVQANGKMIQDKATSKEALVILLLQQLADATTEDPDPCGTACICGIVVPILLSGISIVFYAFLNCLKQKPADPNRRGSDETPGVDQATNIQDRPIFPNPAYSRNQLGLDTCKSARAAVNNDAYQPGTTAAATAATASTTSTTAAPAGTQPNHPTTNTDQPQAAVRTAPSVIIQIDQTDSTA